MELVKDTVELVMWISDLQIRKVRLMKINLFAFRD
jgi:hypothetical protein